MNYGCLSAGRKDLQGPTKMHHGIPAKSNLRWRGAAQQSGFLVLLWAVGFLDRKHKEMEVYLFLFFVFCFFFGFFFVFRGFWLLASGFCGFWLLWLLYLSIPIYLSIFLSFFWQLFSFLFLYLLFLLFSLQRRNKQASKHELLTFGSGVLLGGGAAPQPPRATKSAPHPRHPRLPRNQYFKVNSPVQNFLTKQICLLYLSILSYLI